MSHTPTPWRAEYIGDKRPDEYSTDATVALVGDYRVVRLDWRNYDGHEEDVCDAEFIVKACNAHDDLVNAFKLVLQKTERNNLPAWARLIVEAALAKAGAL